MGSRDRLWVSRDNIIGSKRINREYQIGSWGKVGDQGGLRYSNGIKLESSGIKGDQ